jgi:hypothetical protein
VLLLDEHGAHERGGHQVVLGGQHQHARLRQLLRPQALAVPHELAAERLRGRAGTRACMSAPALCLQSLPMHCMSQSQNTV